MVTPTERKICDKRKKRKKTEEKVRHENTQHPDKANNKKCYVFNTFQIYSFSRNELLQ